MDRYQTRFEKKNNLINKISKEIAKDMLTY